MTDHTIPVDKIQDILTGISNGVYEVGVGRGVSGIAEDLRSLLPVQTPRTMADMTPAEREACKWMQCEESYAPSGGTKARGIILSSDERNSLVLEPSGSCVQWTNTLVTPLPDEPRMKWPASVPVTEDTPESEQPQTEDVKPDPQPGEAWLIEYEGRRYEAVYWYSPIYAHWDFVESREGLKTVESPEATPVSRLVPERGDVS